MIALMFALSDPQLVETGVGRFAHYADVASIRREGDVAWMRELQVAEEGFRVGPVVYVGGWSRWAFDCRLMTADRLDFASLRADGVEGPATSDNTHPIPPRPAATRPNCWRSRAAPRRRRRCLRSKRRSAEARRRCGTRRAEAAPAFPVPAATPAGPSAGLRGIRRA